MAQAKAYMDEHGLVELLQDALSVVVAERAEDGAARLAEVIRKAAHERDNVRRMRALFDSADTNGNGAIDKTELARFQRAMGEPLTDRELDEAFTVMGGGTGPGAAVGFEAFAAWYQSARANGGALSRKGEAAVQRKTRASRFSRVSYESVGEVEASFDLEALVIQPRNAPGTLEYRVALEYRPSDGSDPRQISPWHDIPLFPAGGRARGEVHMVVEIPKWSRAKFEIATGEELNPIKQDVKKGRLRDYTYGDMLFNYGCFPQTWEDPSHTTADTGCAGDNDPIDAMEIGTQIRATGCVVRVKVLGCLAMIDDGETDWKVVCIACDDPLAQKLDDIADVEREVPGLIGVMREWLRKYKTVDGKQPNAFGLEERALDKAYTMRVVDETHQFWQRLIDGGQKTV